MLRAERAPIELLKEPKVADKPSMRDGAERYSSRPKGHRLDSRQRESTINRLLTAESFSLRTLHLKISRQRADDSGGLCGDSEIWRLGGGARGIRNIGVARSLSEGNRLRT